MSDVDPSIIAQSWPWGSQIAVKKRVLFAIFFVSSITPISGVIVFVYWSGTKFVSQIKFFDHLGKIVSKQKVSSKLTSGGTNVQFPGDLYFSKIDFILSFVFLLSQFFLIIFAKILTVPNFSGLSRNQAPCREVPKYNKLVPNSSFFSTVEENPKFLFFHSPKSLFFYKSTSYSIASSTIFKYFKSRRWCLFKNFSSSVHLYLENLIPSL